MAAFKLLTARLLEQALMWTDYHTSPPFFRYLPSLPPDSVSLNVNGSRYITPNQVETVICRVTHNATSKSIVFHLNGDALDGTHQLQIDRTVRVEGYENCFVPPSSSQDKCNELILVVRAVPDVNNSRIFCRARSRDINSDMRRIDSSESVTIVVKDSGTLRETVSTQSAACV